MARRLKLGGLFTVLALCATASTATAQTSSADLTCRASAAAVSLGDRTIDPLVANDPNDPCTDDGATVPSLDAHDALGPDTVDAKSQTAFAVTSRANEGGPTYSQSVSSQAGIENLDLNLGGGALHITAQGLYSTAGARCAAPNGVAEFPTFVRIIGLTVNDQPVVGGEDASIPLSSGLTSAFGQLSDSPLGGVVTVRTERVLATSTGVTVEAARIELLNASGAPVVTVVLGSAKAGIRGDACRSNVDGTDANGTAGEQCADGLDNDGDGRIDAADPECHTDGNASNTASYAPGIASEGPGNISSSSGGPSSSADSTGAPRPNGRNASNCARMKGFWSLPVNGSGGPQRMHSGPKVQRSKWMTRKVIRGRLVNCKGRPIIGAKITLLNYVKGNLRLVKTGVKTREKGEFMMITPNNYTTRRLVFSYRGFLNRPKVAARSKLRIIVTRNGKVLR